MGDVSHRRVLRELKVLHDGTRGHHTAMQVVDTESLQRLRTEMLQQFLTRRLFGEHPVVEFEHTILRAEITLEVVLSLTTVEHLLRLEVAEEFLYMVVGAFTRKELTRGDIEERHTTGRFPKVNSSKEVVLLVVQHVVAHCHTWRNEFRHTTLDERLREFRVL